MSFIGPIVMSAYLSAQPQDQLPFENPERAALRYAGKAIYKQYDLDKYAKRLEKKYISDDLRKIGAPVIILTRIVTEQRLSYEWTF